MCVCVCVCERERERERFLGSVCLILLTDTLFKFYANTYSLVRSVYNSTFALPLSGFGCKIILAL